MLPLLQGTVPSLRVLGSCVEYRFLQHGAVSDAANPELFITIPCRDITVYVNGVPDAQGPSILQALPPWAVERIEGRSPAEAGLPYQAGNRGVVLVEMRQGMAADAPYRIHVNGFGWNEPESYPWLRVLGVTALGSAAVVGITSKILLDCGEGEDLRGFERCPETTGVAAALLTGAKRIGSRNGVDFGVE